MRMTLGIYMAALVTIQGAGASRAEALTVNPSQMSVDCEQALAMWFVASYSVFADSDWRAVAETHGFAQLNATLQSMDKSGCIEAAQEPEVCAPLHQTLIDTVATIHATPRYRAFLQSDTYQVAIRAFWNMRNGECISLREAFFMEYAVLP